MRAVVYDEHGGLDRLHIREVEDPELAPDEVRLEVAYVALNALDVLVREGLPQVRHPFPMIPGGDIAGVLVEVGKAARAAGWSVGDRVVVYPTHPRLGVCGESALGGLAERFVCHLDQLVALPEEVALQDAAALPTAYGAASHMLFSVGHAQPGESVLVLGASGGVGSAVVQLAAARGVQSVAAVSTSAKVDYVKGLGADHVIDLSSTDLMERCFELFGRPRAIDHETHLPGHTAPNPPGIDIVVNYVAGETWHAAMRCTRAGGRILTCGALGGHLVQLDLRYVWSLQLQVLGATGWSVAEQEELVKLVAAGALRPSIDSVHDFDAFGDAFERLTSKAALGKVLVSVADIL